MSHCHPTGYPTVSSSPKIPVLIALGDFASGVTSWALRLREAFANHPRYEIRLMNCARTGNRIGRFDLEATTRERASELIAACGEAIVVPNFVWDLFPVCAERIAAGQPLRCVGFCRADSEEEYYAPLRWYAPLINHFAGVSPACVSVLSAQHDRARDAFHTLPTGVWVPERLTRDYSCTPLRMAYGGRMVQEQKRVLDFVPLVEGLYERGVDFRFSLMGAGRERDELEAALKSVDSEGRVHFLARRKPEAMAAFWAEQDVFVQTSAFEGTSNSMLESMAQGAVPVVTHTESGVDGIIHHGENGFLVAIGDMATMAAAIARLAKDPARLEVLGRRAHATTLPYSMESYVEKFTALLDACMTESPRNWPEGRATVPPQPFHGIRLPAGEGNGSEKGRIAILFPSPLRGGAEDYTLTIAEGAVRAGYDVQGAFPNKVALKSLIEDYFRVGAFHNTLEICDVGAKAGQAPLYKRFTRTVRLLRRLKPRAVLFQLCGMQYGLVSLFACACLGMPTLVVFQLVRDDIRFSLARRLLHRWMRYRGQQYVAVSAANRRLLARAFAMAEEAILIIPNGVKLARFADDPVLRDGTRQRLSEEWGIARDATLCLTVGRLAPQKGHDVLIPAIPHIVAAHPNVHFIWAGEGPSKKALIRQLETYHCADRVTFLGLRDDIPALLQAADYFVHPARFEGQPFSLLEAMASGLPVISTTASGIREVIEDGVQGRLCPPDDIAALRETVIAALNDPAGSQAMATAARERVNAFSEAAMIRDTLAALEIASGNIP